jgi:hypothetical protein
MPAARRKQANCVNGRVRTELDRPGDSASFLAGGDGWPGRPMPDPARTKREECAPLIPYMPRQSAPKT